MEADAKCQPLASTHAHSLTCVHIHRTPNRKPSQKSFIRLNGISVSNMANLCCVFLTLDHWKQKSIRKGTDKHSFIYAASLSLLSLTALAASPGVCNLSGAVRSKESRDKACQKAVTQEAHI